VPPVALGDDDGGVAAWQVAAGAPGRPVERCIVLNYTGSEPAEVRMYATGTPGDAGTYLDIEITAGTGGGGGACTGFAAAGAPVWSGTLADLLTGHDDWEDALPLPGPSGAAWTRDDRRTMRMRAVLRDDPAANGGPAGPLVTGTHGFVWEARGG